MLSHPDSVIALGILRHQELQAENAQGANGHGRCGTPPRAAGGAEPDADPARFGLDPDGNLLARASRKPRAECDARGVPRGRLVTDSCRQVSA